MRERTGRITSAVALALPCLILLALGSCARAPAGNIVICGSEGYTHYPAVAARMLPACAVKRAENMALTHLEQGAAVEAFDTQALPALEAGAARYWYPQYLATVVIAVDRGQTDAEIRGWRDLESAGVAVGFSDANINSHMLMAAMAYGLEGEGFTLGQAAKLLASLQAKKLLARRAFHTPVVICYDYQAAVMAQSGRDIEAVVPEEGTLTYEKGLLSNRPLEFAGDTDAMLRAAGLRLEDGGESADAYENAARVTDYDHLNTVCRDVERVLRRAVFHVRLYSSADAREHQLFALAYMILVVMWTASVLRRAMQRGVRRASLLTGILLLGWAAVRLLKYQTLGEGLDSAQGENLDRALWYGFYFFQLALPLVLLWLAWVIDRPDGKATPPKWLAAPAAVNAALMALVFTNDLHHWVLRIDYSNPDWNLDYTYGPGYYVVLAGCAAPVLAAVALMLFKNGRNPRRTGFLFPLAFCVLLAAYGAGYLLRVPVAWESDITMVFGLFALLFMETSIRAGIIPVNTKYTPLFTHSPLGMQILDKEGNVVLTSVSGPLRQDADTLLFTAPIAGGSALWREDIGALNRLHREVEESVRRLTAANAVLAEEERIKRAVDEENARTQLMGQLEAEIAGHTARLSDMIAREPGNTGGIVLLLCYIKRRCNLFFRGLETRRLPAGELAAYIDELAELAGYAGVKIIAANALEEPLELRRATLLYDYFYQVAGWAAGCACSCMLAHLGAGNGMVTLRLLPAEDARAFQLEEGLAAAIACAGGAVAVKDLDGAVGLSLSFPEGGEALD